ncbi:hypothetical protein N7532_009184 [Penicillium argentinense]|uniref:Homeobox domain-containing protein n=1 Tax=Penicillium argentinense TaxID=1131581 RepID=A0A9W9EYZ5_9EURO|nr:uncharacterized protein N7532_009184 [Penicillium argentinense]KAJ5090500.1 hypothetical protein N7532_009184 [Penicillium argentinense]
MSIGGPCLWVPSLSSPASSPLSTVTSHLSSVARHGERVPSLPRTSSPQLALPRERLPGLFSLGRSAEMQRAGATAENASTTPMPVHTSSTAASGSYGGEIPSRGLESHGREDLLPRVKLEIPGLNQINYGMSQQPHGGSGHVGEASDASQVSLNAKDQHDQESTVSPSDERADTVDTEDSKSPSLEKKKMKRFRLTHNQTRFLMSEFTRQAHPDAAHRERLSREIPGLTPRQVQVWFQNRRAKLKRLTTNDRERMLKSRALPDDFDTTKVLRTPFESKSTGQTPVASPHDYAPNPDFATLRTLRTDCFQRPNEDDYMVSPLSSASTAGTYMSSAGQGRTDGLSQSGMIFGRPAASASMSDLHRTIRSDYSLTRSSSLSDASSQQSTFHPNMQLHNRFAPPSNQPGLPYGRQMDYSVPRLPGMMAAYDQPPTFEGSVSPTDSQGNQLPYDMSNLGTQPQSYQPHLAMSTAKDYSGLGMTSQLNHGRPMSTMQSLPQQDYRTFSYASPSGSMGTIPYTQSNSSTMSLPTSFAPTESGSTAQDPMNQQNPDPLRNKFNPPFSYPGYIQQ